jgi:RNA polymerase sigma-70 factor (ECF subfamily)
LGLKELTTDQQHVLALRFGSGCSLAETAEIMGKKPNAIKQLQFRALAALRKNLEGEI